MTVKGKYSVKDVGVSVALAGVLMFGGFLVYYAYLIFTSHGALLRLMSVWCLIPLNIGINPSTLIIFAGDAPKISYALNSLLTGSFSLIFMPFVFAILITISGILIWRKRGNLKVLVGFLVVFTAFALAGFFSTFVPITPIVLAGAALLLGLAEYVILYSSWMLLKHSEKRRFLREENYVSAEEYWRRSYIPSELVCVCVLMLIVSVIGMLLFSIWNITQMQNTEHINSILGVLESMLQ